MHAQRSSHRTVESSLVQRRCTRQLATLPSRTRYHGGIVGSARQRISILQLGPTTVAACIALALADRCAVQDLTAALPTLRRALCSLHHPLASLPRVRLPLSPSSAYLSRCQTVCIPFPIDYLPHSTSHTPNASISATIYVPERAFCQRHRGQ